MILSQILEEKRREVALRKSQVPLKELIEKVAVAGPVKNGFRSSISRAHGINLIAELKRKSPTGGVLREDFDPVKIAQIYQSSGAAALSVLTDEKFFDGRLEYIDHIKKTVTLPVLRKDFIIDEYQIYESALHRANALLLIADILSDEELTGFIGLSGSLGMDVLVEVHNEEDLQKALSSGSHIIGINNRDMHTFKVDLNTTKHLSPLIPKGKIIVAESGIRDHKDIMFFKSLGVNAVLVGEIFMRSPDIAGKVKELIEKD